MSAIQMEGTHSLDGVSWHVRNSNEDNSQTGCQWDWRHFSNLNGEQGNTATHTLAFHSACQQFKRWPEGKQLLTLCMRFHGGMSAIQIEARKHTVTHSLNGNSWWHVSDSNGSRKHTHTLDKNSWQHVSDSNGGDSLTEWDFIDTSAIQMVARMPIATHSLDGILCQHVRGSNGGQERYSNSRSAWDFMAACQGI